ncbi:MAG: Lon family ATP-dependent protease [Bacillota bacterium]|nr:Lon family ATP-dependent protease [Bacillota bacterium]
MKGFIRRILEGKNLPEGERWSEEEQQKRQVAALFGLLSSLYGSDKLILKAGKLEALHLMRSPDLRERVLALERLVYEDPTIDELPPAEEIPAVLNQVEDEIADLLARKTVEDKIEKKIAERMQQRHEDYVKEIKMQVLKEDSGPENPQTLKKLSELEELEKRHLSRSAVEALRPRHVSEVVGQERAIKALFAKIASPYPQHVILYGPPGVGKTTVARLALEEAKRLPFTPFAPNAPFVETDGATLRWDPREVTNPLLGSVHDPIYQGARRDLAEGGVPEPKLGLVTEAHGGILFIDEIGELDPLLQNKLLKVLEDKRVSFDSAYYDPTDPNVPKYVKKLFEEGAPADFILIGATTRDPSEISPALRSRCAEIFFEPLTPDDIVRIIRQAADRLHVTLEDEVPELIAEYTMEGRKATQILADAYGVALYREVAAHPERWEEKASTVQLGQAEVAAPPGAGPGQIREAILRAAREIAAAAEFLRVVVTCEDIREVYQSSRLTPNITVRASESAEVGKVFGLGVSGFLGSVIELEAVAFPAREPGKGLLRFNETAGSMAKDSVFNAASVFRRLTGKELSEYDVHVNVVGGGRIDGPSAGTAVLLVVYSAVEGRPVRQDVAVTGELSIQGRVRAVGGIYEKIYGAKQAGVRKVIIPAENRKDVPPNLRGIEVVPVETVDEALAHVLAEPAAQPADRPA